MARPYNKAADADHASGGGVNIAGQCRPCGLWRTSRVSLVPGEGDRHATLVLLGEGLGAEEEEHRRPFIGRAGDVLHRALREADLLRGEVWLTNSVRCRPLDASGKNRTPTKTELGFCRGWLDDELATLPNKRVIVALGASATWAALHPQAPTGGVTVNRGRVFWSEAYRCWVVVTVHPAFVLRKPAEATWLTFDILKAKRIAQTGQPPNLKLPRYEVIRTLAQAHAMRETLLQAGRISFDWETNGVHLTQSRGYCVAFASDLDPEFAYVVPRYGPGMAPVWARRDLHTLDHDVLLPIFRSGVPFIGANVAFDGNITRSTLGEYPANIVGCTQVLHHLVNNHLGESAHGLKSLSDLYTPYGRYDDPLDQWLVSNGYVRDGKPDGAYIYRAPDELVHPYNATDAIVPLHVEPILLAKAAELDVLDVYHTERIPLMLSYMRRDREGIRIDAVRLDSLGDELDANMAVLDARIAALAGEPLNANSPQQVQKYLYETRGFPVLARTETGQPSTKEEVLKEFEEQDPVVPLILHRRAYGKLQGTFVRGNKRLMGGLKAAIDADGRARTNTLLTTVETFRLATRRPFPVHVIPRPIVLWSCPSGHGQYLFDSCCAEATKVSLSVRSLIVPDPGHKFIAADHVQQEYAIAAICAGQQDWEEAMLDRREDAHEFVMQLLSGRTKAEYGAVVDGKFQFHSKQHEDDYKNLRSDFKRINFMILYRGGARKLAASLTDRKRGRVVDETEAAEMIANYYERLDRVRWWQYGIIKELRRTGLVRSPFKTFRKLPGIFSSDRWDQYEAERMACNAPIQIAGYHVTHRGVLRLEARWAGAPPLRAPFPGRVLFTVHDEVVAQVRQDLVAQADHDMQECMEAPHPELVGGCGIPRGILTDRHVQDAWGDHSDPDHNRKTSFVDHGTGRPDTVGTGRL